MTQQEFLAGLSQIKTCWPHEKWTPERMRMWYGLLENHDARDWVGGVKALVRSSTERFCPPPAVVIELVNAARDDREAYDRQSVRQLEGGGGDQYVGADQIRELLDNLAKSNSMKEGAA